MASALTTTFLAATTERAPVVDLTNERTNDRQLRETSARRLLAPRRDHRVFIKRRDRPSGAPARRHITRMHHTIPKPADRTRRVGARGRIGEFWQFGFVRVSAHVSGTKRPHGRHTYLKDTAVAGRTAFRRTAAQIMVEFSSFSFAWGADSNSELEPPHRPTKPPPPPPRRRRYDDDCRDILTSYILTSYILHPSYTLPTP